MVAATQALQLSLSGDEQGSLLSQLKLMRQEQADEFRLLRSSFDSFAQKMTEDGSKALIEALKEVRLAIATVAEEAGHSRTLIGHENCQYPETRLTILDAIKNLPGRKILQNEEYRLTSEKVDLENKLSKRRTTYTELAARVNAYERGLLSEPKKTLIARIYPSGADSFFQGETPAVPHTLDSTATISDAAHRPVPDNEKQETLKQRIKRLRRECRDLKNRLDEHDTAYCELVLRARADERGHLTDGKRKVKATPAQHLASLVVVSKSNRHTKE